MSANRPQYIPGKKRNRPQRFHGAFTGGFSAGYFNSVGSKEGWTPSEGVTQQPIQHFMDEEDHNDWGGPSSLSANFSSQTSQGVKQDETKSLFTQDIEVKSENIGEQLLRLLGWRAATSSAYIKDEERFAGMNPVHDGPVAPLSERMLKKVILQQKRVNIPQPKLDTVGLGHEPFANAPEFRQHRENRRKLAKERSKKNNRKVYRVTDALNQDVKIKDETAEQNGRDGDDDELYISYETSEDFVGSRSMGGFALNDDEDDTYDDAAQHVTMHGKLSIDTGKYNTEIFDGELESNAESQAQPGRFSGLMSSWAGAKHVKDLKSDVNSMTSADGKAPLEGFAMVSRHFVATRFAGPDIPATYSICQHVFNDSPAIIKALSHAEDLLRKDASKREQVHGALEQNAISYTPRPKLFAGVGNLLQKRFTATSTETDKKVKQENSSNISGNLVRSVVSFAPAPLLCKRFGVPVPMSAKQIVAVDKTDSYVDSAIAEARQNTKLALAKAQASFKERILSDELAEKNPLTSRPGVDIFKSIFEVAENDDGRRDHEAHVASPKLDIVPKSSETAREKRHKDSKHKKRHYYSSDESSDSRRHRKKKHSRKHRKKDKKREKKKRK